MARVIWRPDIPLAETDLALVAALAIADTRGRRVRPPILAVKGVAIGGCVDAVGTPRQGAMRRGGHAHTSPRDRWVGWLCFKTSRLDRLVTPTGLPSRLLWHEWAHVYVRSGHTEAFRALLRGVGQVAESRVGSDSPRRDPS